LQEELAMAIRKNQRENTTLTLISASSQADTALQVADIVAWSVFQRYEREDDEFYRTVRSKIVLELIC
jgi:phosphoribosylanthranilate isomerase